MARRSQGASLAIRRQADALQRARDSLSIDKFLSVLSQVALNGTMPRYTAKGEIIQEDEPELVEPKLRLQTTQYLIDKVMSNPAPVTPMSSSEDAMDDSEIKKLSYEELKSLAFGALKEAIVRSETEQRPKVGNSPQQTVGSGEAGTIGTSPPGTDQA
jgi:hypothetical protein